MVVSGATEALRTILPYHLMIPDSNNFLSIYQLLILSMAMPNWLLYSRISNLRGLPEFRFLSSTSEIPGNNFSLHRTSFPTLNKISTVSS